MKSMGRWVFWGIFGLFVVVAIIFAFRPEPVWVDLTEARRAGLSVTIVEEGKTRVKDRYVVSSPVAGYLHRVELEVGDELAPNQLVTELDPMPVAVLDARSRAEAEARVEAARASLDSARQNVSAARADAELAHNEYQRLLRLGESNFVSGERLQQAQAAASRAAAILRSASFTEEVAAHELAAARTRLEISAGNTGQQTPLEQVPIRSPVRGRVLGLLRENEGVVQAGTPILEVGDPEALEVVVDVLSFDAVKLRQDMPVILTGWGGPELAARVRRVEPVGFEDVSALGVEEQRVQVVVDLMAPREVWENLGDGYRVDAAFVLWQGDDELQVPASAVFNRDGQSWLFVVIDEVAHLRDVVTGHGNGLMIVVESGLEAGEWVVRHPDRELADGQSVKVR
ncbi:efflux RND transporter periplasmic adaptor subunit [Marinobacter zhejiangensis]|uniref:HlyD family secretion protein n=1 Tax=Marinobacter zhejiangensis TaxID=488535 RepID=A0A1I4REP5_9GAMM|nr:HlyD family efflux transporter periplasmic adaptor subunit [Marinobacter zhejiangensis]SFM50744.1 HlyD family secretion protein [Marinobacter zhejiangensis]